MKRRIILILISLIVCCFLAALFWDGYYLPYKPCRPITYPDGKTTTAEYFSNTTIDGIEQVLQFFDQRLVAADPSVAVTNQWRKVETNVSNYLYYCYASDLNLVTTESGCIYVDSNSENTEIRYMFFRSEGANTPCPR